MPADPISAGRKGGSRNTPAQRAARKRNGFQPQKPPQESQQETAVEKAPQNGTTPALFIRAAQPKATD
jgi:hypothetical protein